MQTLIYALLCGKSCLGRNGLKRLLKIPFSCKLLLHHFTFLCIHYLYKSIRLQYLWVTAHCGLLNCFMIEMKQQNMYSNNVYAYIFFITSAALRVKTKASKKNQRQ